jgi:hypothetical protein
MTGANARAGPSSNVLKPTAEEDTRMDIEDAPEPDPDVQDPTSIPKAPPRKEPEKPEPMEVEEPGE